MIPALVFLDEPTSALDPVGRHDVREVIRSLKQRGTTVFLNSHLLTEVEQVCDRVAVVDHGRVIASGTLDEILGAAQAVRFRATELSSLAEDELRREFGELAMEGDRYALQDIAPERVPDLVAAIVRLGGRRARGGVARRDAGGSVPAAAAGRGRGVNAPAALVIAWLTLREASRRRLLIAVVVLTLILVCVSAWGFERITSLPCRNGQPCSPLEQKAIAAILVTLITFMYSRVFAIGAVFVAAPAIAAETESGVLLAMLPRPLRRSDLILGKWLGLCVLIGGYAAVTAGAEFLAVQLLVGYTPPHPFLAIGFLVGESVVMLTLALLFSTRLPAMTGGIIALVLAGLTWIGGIAEGIGAALGSEGVRVAGLATRIALPGDGLWRGALFNIQPSFVQAAADAARGSGTVAMNPFFSPVPPSPEYVAWCVAWVVLMLGLAMFSFGRRDL